MAGTDAAAVGRMCYGLVMVVRPEKNRRRMFEEQKRIRDNLARIPKDSDLYRRYITTLTDQEAGSSPSARHITCSCSVTTHSSSSDNAMSRAPRTSGSS